MMTQSDAEKLAYAFAAALADEADMDTLDALVEKHAGETVTLGMLAALVFPILVGANAKNRGREKEIKQIDKEIKQIKERPILTYRGVWQRGSEYAPASILTHRGSSWHANETTRDEPGTSSAWLLMTKAGRDGKDGKDLR